MIQFTLSQAWTWILAICGGIVTISAAVGVGLKIYNHLKKPNRRQDEEISKLWRKVNDMEDTYRNDRIEFMRFFQNDKARLDAIEEGNRVTQRAILALLRHGIDGNDIDSMREAENDLHSYLLSK